MKDHYWKTTKEKNSYSYPYRATTKDRVNKVSVFGPNKLNYTENAVYLQKVFDWKVSAKILRNVIDNSVDIVMIERCY